MAAGFSPPTPDISKMLKTPGPTPSGAERQARLKKSSSNPIWKNPSSEKAS